MKPIRRTILKGIAAGAIAVKFGAAMAQQKLLRMIVPLTPGTTPDLIGRAIGPAMQSRLDMNYIVDNRPGASGMIGMNYVAKSTDPNTLMIVPATTLTLPMFYKKVDFDVLNGFTPITQVSSTSFVLVVHKDVPARNLPEFITWAKTTKNNFYASPGVGTHHHLCMLMLEQSAGISLEHVPYKGSSQAFTDLVGGQVPTMFMPIQVAVPLAKAGQLKIIGGSLRYRHPAFPDIPTLAEQGAANYHVDPWYAVWGPPKLPAAAVAQYRTAIMAALQDATVKENLTKEGLILKTTTPEELLTLAKNETLMWRKVTLAANVKPE
ncbi:tripartite tricarboxylate transporter substrate binding protein [Oxalobacteraceae bacterium CAVE-383]|nr:tripartite tricarboxylate transporter substrate binding protein [Oxalobacteraceae bacterium CAVE-383]